MPHRLIHLGVAALALAGFLTLAPRASADQITLVLETNGTGVYLNPNGGSQVLTGSGPFLWSQGVPLNANFPPSVLTYCIDLEQFIYLGQSHVFAIEPNLALAPTIGSQAKAAAITELFDRYFLSGLTSTANQNAFQIALWELVYDGPNNPSLSTGYIQASDAQAQALLSSLGTPYSNHDLAGSRLLALVSNTNQDQLVVVPASVPAPPAAVLAGIALLLLAARAYRNRRTAAA
jgi:hypothetical protein